MLKYKPYVLALDLEGTLISNAVSQFSRPGLYNFLEYCHNNFCRIVIFTAVSELSFRKIAIALADAGKVPSWFVNLEYINWDGKYKDLCFVPETKFTEVILIDDREEYIKQEQKNSGYTFLDMNTPILKMMMNSIKLFRNYRRLIERPNLSSIFFPKFGLYEFQSIG
ncbi:MAG: hypothetical protein HC942_17440 [Microcoleus sp. SU_5_6]|nr:hypothetical protein [Microcoleus sp. SU_5_6]